MSMTKLMELVDNYRRVTGKLPKAIVLNKVDYQLLCDAYNFPDRWERNTFHFCGIPVYVGQDCLITSGY